LSAWLARLFARLVAVMTRPLPLWLSGPCSGPLRSPFRVADHRSPPPGDWRWLWSAALACVAGQRLSMGRDTAPRWPSAARITPVPTPRSHHRPAPARPGARGHAHLHWQHPTGSACLRSSWCELTPKLSGGGDTTPDLRLHHKAATRRCPPPSAVGRDKARYLAARLLIPPVVTVHATFTAHGGRPQGHLPSFPAADIDQDALA
jgi:hypothetical protein